jgi:hypothetical protein
MHQDTSKLLEHVVHEKGEEMKEIRNNKLSSRGGEGIEP